MMHYNISRGYNDTPVFEITTTREVNLRVGDNSTTVYVSLANVKEDSVKVTKSVDSNEYLMISVSGTALESSKSDKSHFYTSSIDFFEDLSAEIHVLLDDANIEVSKEAGMLLITIRSVEPKQPESVVLFDSSAKSDKPWNK